MRKVTTILVVVLVASGGLQAQNGFGIYGLGEAVVQNAHLNPSFQSPGKLIIGLPVVSEMGLHVNNRFSYNQAFTKLENDTILLDGDKLVANLRKKNLLQFETRIPLIYVGIKPEGSRLGYSFFVNERISSAFQYQEQLVRAFWDGTAVLLKEEIDLKKTAAYGNYTREYGLGVTTAFLDGKIKVGARLKLIQGIANAKTEPDMEVKLSVDPATYKYSFILNNAGISTSGFDKIQSVEHIISNKNKGAAIDLGANWEINDIFHFAVAINDVGFVNWKEDIKNYFIKDTTFVFGGIDYKADLDMKATIDSLVSAFDPKENSGQYSSMLSSRSVISGSLLLSPVDRVTVTVMNQLLVGQIKTGFSVAYQKQLTSGITATGALIRLPQQWPVPGAAVVFHGGPVQYYVGSDNLASFVNLTRMKVLDLKMGVNIALGNKKPKNQEHLPPAHRSKPAFSSKGNGVDYPTDPRLRKPKTFRKVGIYDIIPKRKQPKSWKGWTSGRVGEKR